MLTIIFGAVVSLISLMVGIVVGIHYGAKFTHRILEREGRLIPRTPPAVASKSDE